MREHIIKLQRERAAALDRMKALVAKAEGENRDLTNEEKAAFAKDEAEAASLKTRIERAELLEREKAASAVPVEILDGAAPKPAVTIAGAEVGEPNALKEKGVKFARMARALAANKGNLQAAAAWYLKMYGAKDVVHAALSASDFEAGGALVPPGWSSEVIELLRANTVVRRMGAQTRPLVNGKLVMARISGGSSFSYAAEGEDPNATTITTGDLELTARKIVGIIPLSNDLVRFSPANVDQIVREDLLSGLGEFEDINFIRGDGTGAKPRGLRYWAPAANLLTMTATPDLAKTRKDIGRLRLALKQAKVKMRRPGYIVGPRTEEYLLALVDGNGNLAFPEMKDGKIGTYPYAMSEQIPENLGGGTESEMYLADFWEVIIGDAVEMRIEVSTEASYKDSGGTLVSAFGKDQTVLRVISEHDLGMRHAAGIAVLIGLTWAP